MLQCVSQLYMRTHMMCVFIKQSRSSIFFENFVSKNVRVDWQVCRGIFVLMTMHVEKYLFWPQIMWEVCPAMMFLTGQALVFIILSGTNSRCLLPAVSHPTPLFGYHMISWCYSSLKVSWIHQQLDMRCHNTQIGDSVASTTQDVCDLFAYWLLVSTLNIIPVLPPPSPQMNQFVTDGLLQSQPKKAGNANQSLITLTDKWYKIERIDGISVKTSGVVPSPSLEKLVMMTWHHFLSDPR